MAECDRELLHTIARRCDAIRDTVNWIGRELHRRRLTGYIYYPFAPEKGFIMSGSNTITLTNAATPANATRYLGILDLTGGTDVPSIVSSNPALLAVVVGPVTGTQVSFGAYPVDTATETDDIVTVTITENTESQTLTFSISGTTTVPESFALDASSAVGAWSGAPTVPSTPV